MAVAAVAAVRVRGPVGVAAAAAGGDNQRRWTSSRLPRLARVRVGLGLGLVLTPTLTLALNPNLYPSPP